MSAFEKYGAGDAPSLQEPSLRADVQADRPPLNPRYTTCNKFTIFENRTPLIPLKNFNALTKQSRFR